MLNEGKTYQYFSKASKQLGFMLAFQLSFPSHRILCLKGHCNIKIYPHHSLRSTRYNKDIFRINIMVIDKSAMDFLHPLDGQLQTLFGIVNTV